MIKTLQRRFVAASMAAVSVLLVLLLGTINIVAVGRQVDARLEMISQNEGDPDNIPMPSEGPPPREPFGSKNDYDTFMFSNFFVVRFDENGDIVRIDVSRTSSVDERQAAALAERACAQTALSGKIDGFDYMLRDSRMGLGRVAVFLDTSSDLYACIRVLLLSVAIGAACRLFMLLFVVLLSRRAIRPIAENIEKQKQFVTNAGHEIKTPIAIIRSNTEAMELYNGENKWSKNIKEQTLRLNELMKNLLTLARMDEGGGDLKPSDCPLSRLLSDSVESFREALALRGIVLKADIQPNVFLRANREHIVQLISVLMDNAAKYTDGNGCVSVSLAENNRRITLRFKNTCHSCRPSLPTSCLTVFTAPTRRGRKRAAAAASACRSRGQSRRLVKAVYRQNMKTAIQSFSPSAFEAKTSTPAVSLLLRGGSKS